MEAIQSGQFAGHRVNKYSLQRNKRTLDARSLVGLRLTLDHWTGNAIVVISPAEKS